ncbi:MAG TPA: adenylosuccinate synthase [candidate division Zixibacteria bacterium]
MPNRVVLGAQWGDEGKGKVIDVLAGDADLVARFAGGANAGHTVKIDGRTIALHLLPVGVLSERAQSLLGNGVVIDPSALCAEIDEVRHRGFETKGRLWISASAHLVLPHHRLIEAHGESSAGCTKIGTTNRGIGPAYADKAARRGVRTGDLVSVERLRRAVQNSVGFWDGISNGLLAQNGLTVDGMVNELLGYRERIIPMLVDASRMIDDADRRGATILFEGAQGALLDIDFGTYPFVTSSTTTIGGVMSGLGVSPRVIDQVVGVVKAYTTRVGLGPFPTEQEGTVADRLQERGHEFGATTGRKRRCGWLDLPALKYAVRISGISHVAITKLDVLDELAEIPVCVAYDDGGKQSDDVPIDITRLDSVKPVYRSLPGWQTPTAGCTDYDDLPSNARSYLKYICESLGVEMLIVSTGPGREETICLDRAGAAV